MRLLLILLLLPLASGYEEIEAAQLRVAQAGVADVLAVGHSPDIVQPGTQWQGFIQFAPGHNISQVLYQICNVGQSCFAPATPAKRVDDNRWEFDTNDYRIIFTDYQTGKEVVNETVTWEAGWRVGVQYFLVTGNTTTPFPESHDLDPETHYFAFDMPAATKESPGLGLLVLIPIAIALWLRR